MVKMIIIKFRIHMYANIVQQLTCVTAYFDGRGFAEHQSSWSWSVSETFHNVRPHNIFLDQFYMSRGMRFPTI